MPVYNQVSPLDLPLVEPMEAVSDGVNGYTSATTDYFSGAFGEDHSEYDLQNTFGTFNGYTGKTLKDAHDTFIRSLKSSGIWGKTYELVLFFGHKDNKNRSLFRPLEGSMYNSSPLQGRAIHHKQSPSGQTFAKSSPVKLQRQRPDGTSYSFLGGAGNITGNNNKQTELRSRHNLPSSMPNGVCMSAYIWNQGSYNNGSGSTDSEYGFSGNFMGALNSDGSKRLSFGGSGTGYTIRVGGNTNIGIGVNDALTGVALHTLNLQSDNSYKIYKNGVEKYSGTNGDTSNLPEGEQMNHFWNGAGGSVAPWDGFLSLTHYSEALTAQQVTALNSAVQTLVDVFAFASSFKRKSSYDNFNETNGAGTITGNWYETDFSRLVVNATGGIRASDKSVTLLHNDTPSFSLGLYEVTFNVTQSGGVDINSAVQYTSRNRIELVIRDTDTTADSNDNLNKQRFAVSTGFNKFRFTLFDDGTTPSKEPAITLVFYRKAIFNVDISNIKIRHLQ